MTSSSTGFFSVAEISIHTLRVEGDLILFILSLILSSFQSTPSVWRVTPFYTYPSAQARPISIHTLRVEGDFADNFGYEFDAISIHTLRVEGDC